MSRIVKPAAKSTDASYQNTVAAIIAILLLLAVVSLLLYQTSRHGVVGRTSAMGSGNSDEPVSKTNPRFVDLGTFGAHMIGEDGEQNLKTSISLKLTEPGLDEKIRASLPEIKHHVNLVLQSKRVAELSSQEGQEKLAQQLKGQIEYVMGFRNSPATDSAQADAPAVRKNGIAGVLFTSFVIQR
jgi:flagellar FliL protein